MSFSVEYIFSLVDRFSGPAVAMAAAAGRMKAAIASAGAAMASLAVRMAALSVAGGAMTLAFVVGGVKRAAEFEEALTSLRRVTNISREEMLKYGQDALRVGVETGKSGVAIAGIMTEGALLGIRGQKSLEEFARTVAKVSVTWDDMGEKMASRSLATLSAQWFSDLAPEKATMRLNEMADAVNELSNRSAFKAPELLKAFERGGVMAKNFGLTPEQFAAYAGTALVVSEKSGELQGTRARMTFQKLAQNIANPTKRAKGAMDELGYTSAQMSAMVKADPQAALLDIMTRVDKVAAGDNLKKIAILGDLVDKRSAAQISAISANMNEYKKQLAIVDDTWAKKLATDKDFMKWLKNGSEGLQQIGEQLERNNRIVTRSGSVNREFANRTESLNFALTQLGVAWDRFRILLAMPLLEPLRNATNGVTDFVTSLANIAESSPKLGAMMTGAAMTGMLSFGAMLAGVTAKMMGFTGAYTALMALGKAGGILTLTVSLVILGIAYWDQIKAMILEPQTVHIKFAAEMPDWMKWFADPNAGGLATWDKNVHDARNNFLRQWTPEFMHGVLGVPNEYDTPRMQSWGMGLRGLDNIPQIPTNTADRIPQAAAERLQIESQIKGQIDPLQVHADPIQVIVSGQVNGPVSGTGSGQLQSNAPRGVSTQEAGGATVAP